MPAVRRVIVVFKTHFDLGFTDLPDAVMAAYTGPMFAAVREVMAATAAAGPGQSYRWTLPAWPLRYLLDSPTVDPASRRAADALVREGRLTWHAYPFTTHTAFCGLEDLVRGLHISRELGERYGRLPRGAKQTDVPGHTWALPSLLARAGVRFLHLGCNAGSSPPQVPPLFFWEGPDGARLLTYYSAGGYGTSLVPPADWPFDTWLAMQQTEDNHGPHRPEELAAMRAEVAEALPGAEVVFGELGDFAGALYANPAQLAQVPVISLDLADTWIHGVGTMPREVARVRALRGALAAAESLATLQGGPGAAPDAPAAHAVARAYENLLLFGEHTWGIDVKTTMTRAFTPEAFAASRAGAAARRMEESWAAKARYVDRAEAAVAEAIAAQAASGPAAPDALTLFEPLGWGRGRWVEAALPTGAWPDGPVDVATAAGTVTGEARQGRLRFPGATAPGAMQRITLRPGPPPLPWEDAGAMPMLENARFRLVADADRGGLASLVDRESGYEWVAPGASEPFGAYRYDLYSAADIAAFLRAYGRYFQDWFVHDFGKTGYPTDLPHLTAYAGGYRAALQRGPGRQTLRLSGGALRPPRQGRAQAPAQTVDLAVTLYDDAPYLDLEYAIRGKAATPFAESAAVALALNLDRPAFRLGQVGSVIDPARDIAAGANRSLWCVDNWVDASDDRRGLAVIPLDAPLVSLGSLGIYEYAPERRPAGATVYGHLFNTQWGTNFPQWHEGDFTFRYRLLPHHGDWRVGRVWRTAWEATRPAALGAGDLTPPQRRVSVSDGLVLLAVKPRRDAPGILVRVWDALGLARTATVRVTGALEGARRCDLLEYPQAALDCLAEDGATAIAVPLAPHAVETIAVAFGA
jgi:alpha-mannosidase